MGYADWAIELELIEKEGIMTLNDYAAEVHAANEKWWVDLETGKPIQRNFGELLAPGAR